MKIKIIDLLNKIANNEEVPERIKDGSFELTIMKTAKGKHYSGQTTSVLNDVFGMERLNDEIEIVDDEKWKTIFDFPNYEVSNKGNIRSKEYNDSLGHLRRSKELKKQVNNCGYEYVILSSKEEKHKTLTVHRIVAKTFIPNPEEKEDVNHIDGNKLNNNVNNLEWTTTQENIIKRYEIGIDGNNYKAVNQYDLDGNYLETYKSLHEAEDKTGISRQHIGACANGKRKSAGNCIWKFAIEEPKKIEKLKAKYTSQVGKLELANKINELIDAVNELKRNK